MMRRAAFTLAFVAVALVALASWAGEIKTPEYTDSEAVAATEAAGLALGDGASIAFESDVGIDLGGNGNVDTGTAGEDLAAGSCAALRTNGKWYKADADTTALAAGLLGWIPTTIGSGNSGTILLRGFVRNDAGSYTIGQCAYVDTIAGALTQTEVSNETGNVVRVAAWARDDSTLWWNPAGTWGVR